MKAPYAAPELVRYRLEEVVGQEGTCSPSNSATNCSCDCCFDGNCTNVLQPIYQCTFDDFTGCGTGRCP